MRNILLLQQHYFPEMVGVARRAKDLSEEFTKNGHKVTVLTSYPRNFRSMPGITPKKDEVLNKVRIIRHKTLFNVGKNPFFRIISYSFYVLRCITYILKNYKKYDIIISMAPIAPAIAGAIANKLFKVYHHFDVPDILPDLGISAGMIKNKFLIKILFKLEKWVYDNSDSISAITKGQIKNINKKGISLEKIHLIPDWIEESFFQDNLVKHKSEINKIIKESDKIIISFIGNIGALQNPMMFIFLMESLKNDGYSQFHFRFIGDGIMLKDLKKKTNELKLKNIEFIGRVNREFIPAYMNASDILVANYLANEYLDICIPGKLYEYAISNRPIIMGSKGEAKNLIEKYKLGFGVKPSSVEAFKKALLNISNNNYSHNPDLKTFINTFSLSNVYDLFDNIFNELIIEKHK